MDLQQAKLILNKINRLYESMELDARNIDVFEQDLMLSYVKQLYDSFSDEGAVAPPTIRRTVTRRATPVIKTRTQTVETPPSPPQTTPIREQAPPPPPAPVIQELPKVVVPEPAKVVVPEPVKVAAPPPAPPKPKANPAHEVLFEQQEARELSDRLSSQPIKDLTKALGINEKILTINELFDKDNHAYNTAMTKLNTLRSFEDAKEVLSDLAEKHNWVNPGKKKKAQIFIKTVRRRYL